MFNVRAIKLVKLIYIFSNKQIKNSKRFGKINLLIIIVSVNKNIQTTYFQIAFLLLTLKKIKNHHRNKSNALTLIINVY